MASNAPARVHSLDLIRGIAVLGILAVNLAGFAGPMAATLSPHVPVPGTVADEWAYTSVFVVFEGKMRALFSILFGASMVLFVKRADASGGHGELLQLRRLGWLAVFGLLHYFLFWWGDILFLYAAAGVIALFMSGLRTKTLLAAALIIFSGWHLANAAQSVGELRAEERVRLDTASPAERRSSAAFLRQVSSRSARELQEFRSGFAEQIVIKAREKPLLPLQIALLSLGETLPLMLIGMMLFRTGFFTGRWDRRRLWQIALGGIVIGGALTLALLAYIWPRHFPLQTMNAVLSYWAAFPHLLMALGYAAALVLAAPRLTASWLGRRLEAAGRMAFSNYIGTTMLMTAIFYGWGLGLVGTLGHAAQLPFVLLGWALMLGWSKPWLARFRQGPLEWLWRSLTERRLLPFTR